VGDGHVRLEMFAPTEAGRESLRQLLPDLRRDLATAGLSASLDLSGQGGPGTTPREHTSEVSPGRANEAPVLSRQSEAGESVATRARTSAHRLDVLA
jgi:hypothetical protein